MPFTLLLSPEALQPRRDSNWVTVGKGTLLCPPPRNRTPLLPTPKGSTVRPLQGR